MLSSVKEDRLLYDDLVEIFCKFLLQSPEKKLFLILDSCRSELMWKKMIDKLAKERISDISFLGYRSSGHIWKHKDMYCVPIGGILDLIFHNTLASKENFNVKNISEIFTQEANFALEQVLDHNCKILYFLG